VAENMQKTRHRHGTKPQNCVTKRAVFMESCLLSWSALKRKICVNLQDKILFHRKNVKKMTAHCSQNDFWYLKSELILPIRYLMDGIKTVQ
jgi:hypothetical protein